MIILIDAYNLLKNMFQANTISDTQRSQFLAHLKDYLKNRSLTCYIVFDGGQDKWPTTVQTKQLIIIQSGYQQSADDYIKDFIAHNAHKDLLLISTDRELCDFGYEYSVPSIDSDLFAHIMRTTQQQPAHKQLKKSPLRKITEYEHPELDSVMMENEIPHTFDTDQENEILEMYGRKLRKRDRKILRKIKKLL